MDFVKPYDAYVTPTKFKLYITVSESIENSIDLRPSWILSRNQSSKIAEDRCQCLSSVKDYGKISYSIIVYLHNFIIAIHWPNFEQCKIAWLNPGNEHAIDLNWFTWTTLLYKLVDTIWARKQFIAHYVIIASIWSDLYTRSRLGSPSLSACYWS